LALLGWSPGDDKEDISMQELVELFEVHDVHSSPARFDMKKLEAINGDKIRALTPEEFLNKALPFLKEAEVISGTEEELSLVKKALPIIQERIVKLGEIPAMLKFLFVKDLVIETESKEKIKDELSKDVLKRALDVLEPLNSWNHDAIETALRKALIEEMGLKPRIAFGAVRIAVTGSHISPPLFESMELLGKEPSISRINRAISL